MEKGCAAPSWRTLNENKTMGPYMSMAGYKTAFFGEHTLLAMYFLVILSTFIGKYLNNYGEPDSGVGLDHVPPGWTRWFALQGNRFVAITSFRPLSHHMCIFHSG